jgi:MoxR-like ATPase
VKTVARAVQADFARIQFTPDLLPADVIGTQIYNPQSHEFTVHKGPIFANLLLADEINRAPAKVQSALLEAMQERQVTIGETTYLLGNLFLVLATQNPIEQEGTYPLPEAQVDRFLFKIVVDYPSREEEMGIVTRMTAVSLPQVQAIITPAELLQARQQVRQIYVDERLLAYAVDLVRATRLREDGAHSLNGLGGLRPYIAYGASPRASIWLVMAARAHAFLEGRNFVLPEDIKQIAPDVLRHRLLTTFAAEAERLSTDAIVQQILEHLPVP